MFSCCFSLAVSNTRTAALYCAEQTLQFLPVALSGTLQTIDFSVAHDIILAPGGVLTDFDPNPMPNVAGPGVGIVVAGNVQLTSQSLWNLSTQVGPLYRINGNLSIAFGAKMMWTTGVIEVAVIQNSGWLGSSGPVQVGFDAVLQSTRQSVEIVNTVTGVISGWNAHLVWYTQMINYGLIVPGYDDANVVSWFDLEWNYCWDIPCTLPYGGLTIMPGGALNLTSTLSYHTHFPPPPFVLSVPAISVVNSATPVLAQVNLNTVTIELGDSDPMRCARSELRGQWFTFNAIFRPRRDTPCSIVFGSSFTHSDRTFQISAQDGSRGPIYVAPRVTAVWNGAGTTNGDQLGVGINIFGASVEWKSERVQTPAVVSSLRFEVQAGTFNVTAVPADGVSHKSMLLYTDANPKNKHTRNVIASAYGWEAYQLTFGGPTDAVIPFLRCPVVPSPQPAPGLYDKLDPVTYNDTMSANTWTGDLYADLCRLFLTSTPRFQVFGSVLGTHPLPPHYDAPDVGALITGNGLIIHGPSGYQSLGMVSMTAGRFEALLLSTYEASNARVIPPSAISPALHALPLRVERRLYAAD